jgi:hypothetical protein
MMIETEIGRWTVTAVIAIEDEGGREGGVVRKRGTGSEGGMEGGRGMVTGHGLAPRTAIGRSGRRRKRRRNESEKRRRRRRRSASLDQKT